MSKVRSTGHNMVIRQLGDKMKELEKANEPPKMDPTKWVLARIDGRTFSTFTRGYEKPFDPRLSRAMIHTLVDLTREFKASIGYTQSDEITLVWSPVQVESGETEKVHLFGGRVTKSVTVLAGYASVRFAYHLSREKYGSSEKEQRLKDKVFTAHFDARVFELSSEKDVIDNLLWRHKFDCKRNAVANYFMSCFSHKAAENTGTNEKLQMLKESGYDYNSLSPAYRFGAFVKRTVKEVDAYNPKTHEKVSAMRTILKARSFPLHFLSDELQGKIVSDKYWPEEGVIGTPEESTRECWRFADVDFEVPPHSEDPTSSGRPDSMMLVPAAILTGVLLSHWFLR